MNTGPRSQQWVGLLILVLMILTPLLAAILGSLCVTPLQVEPGFDSNQERLPAGIRPRELAANGLVLPDVGGAVRAPGLALHAGAGHGSTLLALDPHDDLHRFALLPALAGLGILAGAVVVRIILSRWRAASRPAGRIAWLQYGLLGFLWWLALSVFLMLAVFGRAWAQTGPGRAHAQSQADLRSEGVSGTVWSARI